jgi:hypothetical protein
MTKVWYDLQPAGRHRGPRRTWGADDKGTQVRPRKLTTPIDLAPRDPRVTQGTPVIHNARSEAPRREALDALRQGGLIAHVVGSADKIARTPHANPHGVSLPDCPSAPGDPYVWTRQGVLEWGDAVPQEVLESVSQRTDDLPPLLLSEVRALGET